MKTAFLSALLVLFYSVASMATTIVVSPGSDAIQNGIDQTTQDGDTVLVNGGTYTENFYGASDHFVILKTNGAVEVFNATGIFSGTPEGTTIEGEWYFTGSNGAGITRHNGGHLTVRGVNLSERDSSPAMFLGSNGGHVVLENCIFEGNQNDIRAGATRDGNFGLIEVRNCVFRGSHDSFQRQLLPQIGDDGLIYYELEEEDVSRDQNYGGALYITLGLGQVAYTDCVFYENSTLSIASVIYNRTANVSAVRCDFISNSSGNGSIYWGSVDDNWGSDSLYLQDCILVGNSEVGQEAVHSDDLVVAGHNVTLPHNHGISGTWNVDPMFCDAANGDYHLGDDSPCLPQNNEWGIQIGALGAGNCAGVDVESKPEQPSGFQLATYPNPFNPSTTIEFSLPVASHVKLMVFNLSGELVATLADGMMPSGLNQVGFDASNLSSGLYFYTLKAADIVEVRKITLQK